MAFTSKDRQRIIDDYLSNTGRNMFSASEFIDWLEGQPDHEAHSWFFGMDDAEAARQHRIGMARRMASGLRIVANVETTQAKVVQITEREYPAYVSPVASRKHGGGYERFDPQDETSLAELRRQGETALRSWLERYRGVFAEADLKAIEKIAAGTKAELPKPARVAQSA